jgi:hypothetical protein
LFGLLLLIGIFAPEPTEEEKAARALEKEKKEALRAEKKAAEIAKKATEDSLKIVAVALKEAANKEAKMIELRLRLEKELEGVKEYKPDIENVTSKDVLLVQLALFQAYSNIITEAKESEDPEAMKLADKLSKSVSSLQKRDLPKLRKQFAKIMKQTLWEHNIEVNLKGKDNNTLELVAGMFANNANKKKSQEELNEVLHQYRFKRVNYKWHKYDDEYTYYTLESKKDTELY